MAQLCPSCNKFAGLEMNDPEVNDLSLDLEGRSISCEVRIVRVSTCCSDEMKEYTFNNDCDFTDEQRAVVDAILAKAPDAEIDVEEGSIEQLEEGGGRYAKSYYGYSLTANITHDGATLFSIELTDKINAASMDELT